MSLPSWLPSLEEFKDYGGDYEVYLEAIYVIFCNDFIDNKPVFQGRRLGLKRHPLTKGKEATFWHMVSEGKVEEDRLLDFRRTERIRWPKPIIENSEYGAIKIWREKRSSEFRVHIWFYDASYLVVLNERRDYTLPWTAYPIEYENQKRKLNKRWERNKED